MWNQVLNKPELAPVLEWQGLHILPGLNAVSGDEGTGKTRLLRQLCEGHADALWLDLQLPGDDELTAWQVWAKLQARWPNWDSELVSDLAGALQLRDHLDKRLFMLSTGSRRKVALAGLLACGSTITCIDQPYAGLDLASIRMVREFLMEAASHAHRAWVVADFEADGSLPWRSLIHPGPG